MRSRISILAMITSWLSFLVTSPSPADPLSIGRLTIDGGGASWQAAGTFTLSGTIGQADAALSSAGSFTLRGGFWTAPSAASSSVENNPAVPPAPETPAITELRILPAAPNPATLSMQVRLALPAAVDVSVQVYDPRGAVVRTLVDQPLPAGHRSVTWNGLDRDGQRVGAGIYFLHIRAGHRQDTQKVTWIR